MDHSLTLAVVLDGWTAQDGGGASGPTLSAQMWMRCTCWAKSTTREAKTEWAHDARPVAQENELGPAPIIHYREGILLRILLTAAIHC
jgi:hypothetical protein